MKCPECGFDLSSLAHAFVETRPHPVVFGAVLNDATTRRFDQLQDALDRQREGDA